jgi:para-nitrobenzyl esterase
MPMQAFTRRQMLVGTAASIATLACSRALLAQAATVRVGNYSGTVKDGVRTILGIPYAQPPIGPLRFSAPQPMAAGATNLGRLPSPAMQPGRTDCSEDCLYLNIYAPEGNGPFPVFVWIHGGGFTGGTPNDTDGTVFAKQGIVVVTLAYRLGVFGFLDWSPLLGPGYADSANNGLRDLIAALKWVNANIRTFGGDPKRVTLGGQSAGAKLTDTLMGIEEAKPYFSQMISESGGAERIRDQASTAQVSKTFTGQFHRIAGKTADPLKVDATALIKSQLALSDAWEGNFPLRAESGGKLLPNRAIAPIASGNTKGKRLLIGTNRDESAFYLGLKAPLAIEQKRLGNTTQAQFDGVLAKYATVYPNLSRGDLHVRALTAEEYWVPSIRVAEAHTRGGGTAWFYRLDELAATGPHRGTSYHSYDLGFVWSHLAEGEPASAHVLARQMHDAWASFIKGGSPKVDGLPAWPQWDPKTRSTMLFSDRSIVEQQPFEAELRLWDDLPFA